MDKSRGDWEDSEMIGGREPGVEDGETDSGRRERTRGGGWRNRQWKEGENQGWRMVKQTVEGGREPGVEDGETDSGRRERTRGGGW